MSWQDKQLEDTPLKTEIELHFSLLDVVSFTMVNVLAVMSILLSLTEMSSVEKESINQSPTSFQFHVG